MTVWLWRDEEQADEASPQFTSSNSRSAEDGSHRNTRWQVALPGVADLLGDQERRKCTDKILTVAVQGRSAPSRTLTWRNEATLSEGPVVEVMAHRTMVMMEAQVTCLARKGLVWSRNNPKPSSTT